MKKILLALFLISVVGGSCQPAYAEKEYAQRYPTGTRLEVYTPNNVPPAPDLSGVLSLDQTTPQTVTDFFKINTLTAGSVLFGGTDGLLAQDNSKLFWDNSTKSLGVGTTSPSAALHIVTPPGVNPSLLTLEEVGEAQWRVYMRHSDGYLTWSRLGLSPAYFIVNSQQNGPAGFAFSGAGDRGKYIANGDYNHTIQPNDYYGKGNLIIQSSPNGTGKVGIGTTAPDRKLTVSDTSGNAQIRLSYDAANYAEIRGGSTGSLYFTSSKGFTYFNAAGKDNKFYAFDYSSTGSPYLYLSAHSLMLNTGMVAGWGAVRLNDKGDSFLTGGNVGIGTTSPTAVLHLKAGTSTASTAPLKLTSGTLLETAEVGAIEFLSDDFFATITTGAARKGIILDDGSRLTSGKIPVATTNGRLVDLTAQDTEADLKVDYTSGDLDTEAEVITAINTTNAKINSIIAKLKTLGLLATS